MIKVKICGLTRLEDIEMVNRCLPDYIGFVFDNQSKRYITPYYAKELVLRLKHEIQIVGVFTTSNIEEILKIVNDVPLHIVQLHGMQTENVVKKLRTVLPKKIKIWYAVPELNGKFDFPKIDDIIDLWVLDTMNNNKFGGVGKSFSWQYASQNLQKKNFVLAGGLNSTNVDIAIKMLHPQCVDVSSGVESEGLKDYKKIKQFIRVVRNE